MSDYLINSGVLFLAYAMPAVFVYAILQMALNAKSKVLVEERDVNKINRTKAIIKSLFFIWVIAALMLSLFAPSHTPKRTIDVTHEEERVQEVYEAERESSMSSAKELKDRLRKNKETNDEREDRFQDMVEY